MNIRNLVVVMLVVLFFTSKVNNNNIINTQDISLAAAHQGTSAVGCVSLVPPLITTLAAREAFIVELLPELSVNTNIRTNILEYLESVSFEYDLSLLQGIIQLECEGTWNPSFIDSQDYGLCQINICNHETLKPILIEKYGYFDILDYRQNIDSMIFILDTFKQCLIDSLGREPTVPELLTAYNRGPYYVQKKGIYRPYVDRVLEYQKEYQVWNVWRGYYSR